MNKKRLAKEVLILVISIILITIVSTVWYFSEYFVLNIKEPEIVESKTGFREMIYEKILYSPYKDSFAEIMEVYHYPTFLSQITKEEINKKVYDKAIDYDYYLKNNHRFIYKQLKEHYKERADEAISKFQFRKETFLTDLNYNDFNKNIQSDTLSSWNLKKENEIEESYNEPEDLYNQVEEIEPDRSFISDFKLISIFILIFAFPLRYLIILLQWSIRELKN